MRENLQQQSLAARADDALAATRLDVAFHVLLAELLDNREAIAWLMRCFDKLHRSILRINRLSAGRLVRSYEDHASIADAILGARSEAAARGMNEHLAYGRRFLLS